MYHRNSNEELFKLAEQELVNQNPCLRITVDEEYLNKE
jgi:hypothetical protein